MTSEYNANITIGPTKHVLENNDHASHGNFLLRSTNLYLYNEEVTSGDKSRFAKVLKNKSLVYVTNHMVIQLQ